jgi:low affinity Fe/Cu permease
MFGNLDIAAGFVVAILMALAWAVPILIGIWFIRTFSAMAAAQRDIAAHLASIDEHLRSSSGRLNGQ